MTPQKKLALVAGAIVLALATVLYLVFRSPSRDQSAPSNPSTPAAELAQDPRAGAVDAAATAAPITKLSDDLTREPEEVEHRVVIPKTDGIPAPQLEYTYTRVAELPTVAQTSVPVDVFLPIDASYANRIAAAYGMPEQTPVYRDDTAIYLGEMHRAGSAILRVNMRSGHTEYETVYLQPGVRDVATPAGAVVVAAEFLKARGQYPAGLDAPMTYARTDLPGVFFVEYHRAWNPLPILETIGMYGTSLNATAPARPADPAIVQTSDKLDGIARADDFNTITVAVDTKGRVLAAFVRMRPVARTLPARQLKTPQVAWEELVAGKGILGLTLPSEDNITDKSWEQIFPGGTATSSDAQVREILLAYAEKPSGVRQTYLQPIYIFKGSAKLATGPLADFLVAVPALADDSLPPQ